jgi:hypothetical protein
LAIERQRWLDARWFDRSLRVARRRRDRHASAALRSATHRHGYIA